MFTTATTTTPGTESVKNHGQYVKAQGGGKSQRKSLRRDARLKLCIAGPDVISTRRREHAGLRLHSTRVQRYGASRATAKKALAFIQARCVRSPLRETTS